MLYFKSLLLLFEVMKKIVIFSGAGMSAESGISTFRDTGGLWEKYAIEDVATPMAWNNNPDLVTDFYNQRRRQIIETLPNEAHAFIASKESEFDIQIITQNIDDLHERAGSSQVVHLHGNIRFSKSSGPNQEKEYFPIHGWELGKNDICPEGFRLRPHVVWFGEEVPQLEKAASIICKSDLFIVIGTSLNVYPAAGLIHAVSKQCKCFLIDPNAHDISVPANFTVISKNASAGIKEVLQSS
jgi:NAD-dependent deacetylase